MRILFITNNLQGNDGRSKVSLDFSTELQNLGCEVLCLTSKSSSQSRIKEEPVLKSSLKYLANPLVSFSTALKVKKEISKFSPDVIHFMVEPYANLLPFLGNLKAKTYVTCHGTYTVIPNLVNNFFKKKISSYLSKSYFQKLTGIITVSNHTKDYLLKYYPEMDSKIKVITNGVNLEENQPIDLDKKPENKIKKILFVGAVKKRKGILQTIEACRYYRDNFSADFIYDIVGSYDESGDYYQTLFKKIKEYGLEDKVFFRGGISDEALKNFYFNADLFLMPSLDIKHNFEGFGLVFLEAAARAIPCIGSKNTGCQEAILEKKTGYLVDPFDFKQIAQKMDLILNQDAISGRDCLLWAKQNDIKIKTRELVEFYESAFHPAKN